MITYLWFLPRFLFFFINSCHLLFDALSKLTTFSLLLFQCYLPFWLFFNTLHLLCHLYFNSCYIFFCCFSVFAAFSFVSFLFLATYIFANFNSCHLLYIFPIRQRFFLFRFLTPSICFFFNSCHLLFAVLFSISCHLFLRIFANSSLLLFFNILPPSLCLLFNSCYIPIATFPIFASTYLLHLASFTINRNLTFASLSIPNHLLFPFFNSCHHYFASVSNLLLYHFFFNLAMSPLICFHSCHILVGFFNS